MGARWKNLDSAFFSDHSLSVAWKRGLADAFSSLCEGFFLCFLVLFALVISITHTTRGFLLACLTDVE